MANGRVRGWLSVEEIAVGHCGMTNCQFEKMVLRGFLFEEYEYSTSGDRITDGPLFILILSILNFSF